MVIAIIFGTAAALAWSINNVLAAAALRSVKTTTGTLVSLTASLLFTIPVALIVDPQGFLALTPVALLWIAALGFFNFPGGRYCTYAAIQRLGATRAILIRNLTPVIAVVIAVFTFGEWPSLQVAIGGLLIVAGLYVAIEEHQPNPAPAAADSATPTARTGRE